ncbi:MAG TPA: hypothetical protein VF600_14765 [Abditibacteriaceae bacterium]|jgi:hypothetical protein
MSAVFVDTGYLLALELANDINTAYAFDRHFMQASFIKEPQ